MNDFEYAFTENGVKYQISCGGFCTSPVRKYVVDKLGYWLICTKGHIAWR